MQSNTVLVNITPNPTAVSEPTQARNGIDVYSMILVIMTKTYRCTMYLIAQVLAKIRKTSMPTLVYMNLLEITGKFLPSLIGTAEKGAILIYLFLDFGGEGDMLLLRE
jgi:hypothetical protein